MTYTHKNNPSHSPREYQNLQEGNNTPEFLSRDMVDDICEMFDDGVPPKQIAEWFGLRKVTVKEVLLDIFPTDIYGNLIYKRKSSWLTLPKLTEPDLFACQLALLVSLGDSFVKDFFDKVRDTYPTVTLGLDWADGGSFYRTPDLEIEQDYYSDDDDSNYSYPYESSMLYSYRLG